MNKRDAVLSILDSQADQAYVPAGFFIHFDPAFHRGQAAINKHLEYFQYTDMDFVKIQYEDNFPLLPQIQNPDDWAHMPHYDEAFFANQLSVVKGLLEAAQKEALVLMTLYSPLMCAAKTAGRDVLETHLRTAPDKVQKGMEIITDSLMIFVKACIRLGIDGFYTSTQGGEADRFGGTPLFNDYIKPHDLALMNEINEQCLFNILHVCDYYSGYDDLATYLDYPGHVVNCSQEVGGEYVSSKELAAMFKRPFMGGLERKGTIATGSEAEIVAATTAILQDAPEAFILGADCTLPDDVNWDNIRLAIASAHNFQVVR